MITVLLLILMIICAFITGIIIWKWCGGASGDKYDPRTHQQIMDALAKRDDLDEAIAGTILKLQRKGKTWNALEETMGADQFKRFTRR